MAGVGQMQPSARQVELAERGGHEGVSPPLAADHLAEPPQRGRRGFTVLHQDPQRRLEHRHPQPGGQPVPRDVGDHHRQRLGAAAQEVEVVAADRGARLEVGGEPHPGQLDRLARQQILLELPGDRQLLVERLLLRGGPHQLLEVRRHRVERTLQLAELIAAPHPQPHGEVAVRDHAGRAAQLVHRPGEADDHEQGDRRGDDVDVEEGHGEHEEERPGRGVDLGRSRMEAALQRRRRGDERSAHEVGLRFAGGEIPQRSGQLDPVHQRPLLERPGVRPRPRVAPGELRLRLSSRIASGTEGETPAADLEIGDRPASWIVLVEESDDGAGGFAEGRLEPVGAPRDHPVRTADPGRRQRDATVSQAHEWARGAVGLTPARRGEPRGEGRRGVRVAGDAPAVTVVAEGDAIRRALRAAEGEPLETGGRGRIELGPHLEHRVAVEMPEEEAGQQGTADEHEQREQSERQRPEEEIGEGETAADPPEEPPPGQPDQPAGEEQAGERHARPAEMLQNPPRGERQQQGGREQAPGEKGAEEGQWLHGETRLIALRIRVALPPGSTGRVGWPVFDPC
ncbi:MAG: hypothetical protein BWX64_01112 [Acidobacteria bacterium ADurb.Bin051]|nr:MAG: hypothetical protein BWX64_01112 [Acidobacteria bacterium ADurb.Bin051]